MGDGLWSLLAINTVMRCFPHSGLHMEFVIKYRFPFLMLMGSLSSSGIKEELDLQFSSLLALQSRGIKCLLLTMALKLGF